MKTAALYILFAAIATAANIAAQALVSAIIVGEWDFWAALVTGTGVGLVVKYVLDKQFIFHAHHLTRPADIGRSFTRYTMTGLLTTALFWGMEIGFHHAFPGWPQARYAGAILGLSLGYAWKYRLDRKFTFTHP